MKYIKKILFIAILSLAFFSIHKPVFAQCLENEIGSCVNADAFCPATMRQDSECSTGNRCCYYETDEGVETIPTLPPRPELIVDGPDSEFFDMLNPLKNADEEITADLSTPGGIVSRLLQFLFPIAALILFVMLVWGGFEILSKSTAGTKGMEAGKNRITAAIVGFLLLFATYWMAQIIEVIFGIIIV